MKRTYCTRKIEVEAIQYDGTNANELQTFINERITDCVVKTFDSGRVFLISDGPTDLLHTGDWIVRDGVNPIRIVNNIEFTDKYEVCPT